MPTPQTTTAPNTRSNANATFIHITDVLIYKANITKALKEGGIEDIPSILKLTDATVENLTFLDPDDPNANIAYRLNKGEKECIRTFIHFVHYQNETGNPIEDDWLNVTVD
jgi:hypothetical protein